MLRQIILDSVNDRKQILAKTTLNEPRLRSLRNISITSGYVMGRCFPQRRAANEFSESLDRSVFESM